MNIKILAAVIICTSSHITKTGIIPVSNNCNLENTVTKRVPFGPAFLNLDSVTVYAKTNSTSQGILKRTNNRVLLARITSGLCILVGTKAAYYADIQPAFIAIAAGCIGIKSSDYYRKSIERTIQKAENGDKQAQLDIYYRPIAWQIVPKQK